MYRFKFSKLFHWHLQVILNGWSTTGIKDAVEKGQGNLEPLDPFNAIDSLILSQNEELISDAVPVINAESLALLSIENLNTGDKSSSNEDDNDDGDQVYEPLVDEIRNFLNVLDSFVDEDDNI